MGGMIAYARIGSYQESRIANLVTVGSPFSFELSTTSLRLWHKVGSCTTSVFPTVPIGSLENLTTTVFGFNTKAWSCRNSLISRKYR
jgi:hypothetical protein